MKNDLSSVVVGDWIWTIQKGWKEVVEVLRHSDYPIRVDDECYTLDGKYNGCDEYPSAFTEPPAEFNAGPKPCRFTKGQRVLVRLSRHDTGWYRRYFSHQVGGIFFAYTYGDEWSSYGGVSVCHECKPWTEGSDE